MTAIVPFPASPEFAPVQACDVQSCDAQAGDAQAVDSQADDGRDADGQGAAFRQLRHQTKNALQRILCHVALQPGLAATPSGRALARDLERRIHLVAAISDALFGFTRAPERLEPRLRALAAGVIELLCDPGQIISLDIGIDGECPPALDDLLVRVAHELIGNAVKHGMHVRLVGRIELAVRSARAVTTMTVSDDGWGYAGQPLAGEGLSVSRMLAEQHDGTVEMRRDRGLTYVMLTVPHARPRTGARPNVQRRMG